MNTQFVIGDAVSVWTATGHCVVPCGTIEHLYRAPQQAVHWDNGLPRQTVVQRFHAQVRWNLPGDSGVHTYDVTPGDAVVYVLEPYIERDAWAAVILQTPTSSTDLRTDGHTYLLGATSDGHGVALVWQAIYEYQQQTLTTAVLEQILDECARAGVERPVHIYAQATTAWIDDDIYRFHQLSPSLISSVVCHARVARAAMQKRKADLFWFELAHRYCDE